MQNLQNFSVEKAPNRHRQGNEDAEFDAFSGDASTSTENQPISPVSICRL